MMPKLLKDEPLKCSRGTSTARDSDSLPLYAQLQEMESGVSAGLCPFPVLVWSEMVFSPNNVKSLTHGSPESLPGEWEMNDDQRLDRHSPINTHIAV